MTNAPEMQQPKKTKGKGVSTASRSKDEEGRTPEDVRRANLVRERVERERGDNGAGLAGRGGEAVCGRLELRREHFGGVAVRRAVWG